MCNIILNQPTIGQLSGSTIQKLIVSGTIIDCQQNPLDHWRRYPDGSFINEAQVNITVIVLVNGLPDPNLSSSMSVLIPGVNLVSGSWGGEVKALPPFPCGSTVRVRAECNANPACFVEQDFLMDCAACPVVQLVLKDVTKCNSNGKRTATFEVTVSNATTPSAYTLEYGDIDSDTFAFNPQQNPRVIQHDYDSGNYTAIVNSVLPEGCFPSNPVDVVIAPCDANCPEVTLTLVSVSNCIDGTRVATFNISASNVPAATCVYEIDFGDGFDEPITFNNSTQMPITKTHPYAAGSYSAVVNCIVPEGCPSSNAVLVQVKPCSSSCPTDIEFEIIDANGNRFSVIDGNNGILEALINNPTHQQIDCIAAGTYIARVTRPSDPGISFTWREDNNPPVQNNSRDFSFSMGNGNTKSITVVTEKDNCPPLAETVVVRTCETECCPLLTGLSASCMPLCPLSTTVTLTASGNNLNCAEAFSWEFGDGSVIETTQPATVHTYLTTGVFNAAVTMVRPDDCGSPRVQRATTVVAPCPRNCFCSFLAIITGFLLLAFLCLMPLIACIPDPTTVQILIITLIVVAILLAIFWLWWLIDPCCRPDSCEMLRILFWVFSWALIILGVLAILQFCVSAIPFGLVYGFIQQVLLNRINAQRCNPGAPDIFSWPFPGCQ